MPIQLQSGSIKHWPVSPTVSEELFRAIEAERGGNDVNRTLTRFRSVSTPCWVWDMTLTISGNVTKLNYSPSTYNMSSTQISFTLDTKTIEGTYLVPETEILPLGDISLLSGTFGAAGTTSFSFIETRPGLCDQLWIPKFEDGNGHGSGWVKLCCLQSLDALGIAQHHLEIGGKVANGECTEPDSACGFNLQTGKLYGLVQGRLRVLQF